MELRWIGCSHLVISSRETSCPIVDPTGVVSVICGWNIAIVALFLSTDAILELCSIKENLHPRTFVVADFAVHLKARGKVGPPSTMNRRSAARTATLSRGRTH